jgi:hypothetical protein
VPQAPVRLRPRTGALHRPGAFRPEAFWSNRVSLVSAASPSAAWPASPRQATCADITQVPYLERKARLNQLFDPAPPGLLVVGQFEEDGQRLYDGAVLPLELEGLVAKRVDNLCAPGVRSTDWVELKQAGAVPAERFRHLDGRHVFIRRR